MSKIFGLVKITKKLLFSLSISGNIHKFDLFFAMLQNLREFPQKSCRIYVKCSTFFKIPFE